MADKKEDQKTEEGIVEVDLKKTAGEEEIEEKEIEETVVEEKEDEKPKETPEKTEVVEEKAEEKVKKEVDTEEPKKKSLKKKILTKKKEEEKEPEEKIAADENGDGYVSAREVVNTLDKDIKVVEKSEDEILANHVAEQLRENQDFFIFRIRKSIALAIAGLLILLLWAIPLVPVLKNSINLKSLFSKDNSEVQVDTVASPSPEVEEISVDRIRIKIEKEDERVASISALLKSDGYSEIDIFEAEVEESGINVAVKKGEDDLRAKLISLLDEFKTGSSSSELTTDSDFSAVILIGK